MLVLDTNVVSEMMRSSPDKAVVAWIASWQSEEIVTTTITMAEILYGISILPEGRRRAQLSGNADELFYVRFSGRIWPFDQSAATQYAKIASDRRALGRLISVADAQIAAITKSNHARLATRNVVDFAHCDIEIVNPWLD